jgi:UDP-N-acetylmuramoyl-L-alanyl-D-glutamate--2,6-diaminopimelate ligase
MTLEPSTELSGLPLNVLLAGLCEEEVPNELLVRGLTLNSEKVSKGDLFIAMDGLRAHGLEYSTQAIESGCSAIVFDPKNKGEQLAKAVSQVPCFSVTDLAEKLGEIASRYYGNPSQYISIVGITGTNGKTSVSHFLAEALAYKLKAGVIGTIGWGEPGGLRETSHTTPDTLELQKLLTYLKEEGFTFLAIEASSHGLSQGRLNGIKLAGAVFTNFTRDHLDYHGSMDAYFEAKVKLFDFQGINFAVINLDDPSWEKLLNRIPSNVRVFGFAKSGRDNVSQVLKVTASSILQTAEGIEFDAGFCGQSFRVKAPIYGVFNVDNLLATLAALIAMGEDFFTASQALSRVRAVPGRMDGLTRAGRNVVVDYAHTPDALENVLRSIRQHATGKVWVVFGCGGDRDKGKRRGMGAIADELADRVILTDDNPRSEAGDDIIDQILGGFSRQSPIVIRDRKKAIKYAIEAAGSEDVVLVAGKGHESVQEIDGKKLHFNDREVASKVLQELE